MTNLEQATQRWLTYGNTGASSKTMAYVVGLNQVPRHIAYPIDVADFSRCLGYLNAVPTARHHLDRLKPVHPVWYKLVEEWEKLEALYASEAEAKNFPKTNARLKEIIALDNKRISLGNGVSISWG